MVVTAVEAKTLSDNGSLVDSELYKTFLSLVFTCIANDCQLGNTSSEITNLTKLDMFVYNYFDKLATLAKTDLENLGYTVSDVANSKFTIDWSTPKIVVTE